ncbi:MAG: hypothetical protein H0W81_06495 [Chloroflexi bacterium]|nr:hypothetical protein [Chloroflexota bacterium]
MKKYLAAAVVAVSLIAASSAQAAPTCSQAGNYAIIQSVNEGEWITATFGGTLGPIRYWDQCGIEVPNNRTYVKWHYAGSQGRILNMEAYVYPGFDSCGGPVQSFKLGNVSYAYRIEATGALVAPTSLGTYATPCE